MDVHPRFQAEYFIKEFDGQLDTYSKVFHDRIAPAFQNLDEEAERIQDNEYARLASSNYGEDDDSGIAEMAYSKGVDYYLATDEIRQGVFNLMIAGLYHLFEQHADTLVREMSLGRQVPTANYALERLKLLIRAKGPDIERFKAFAGLDELRLVANTVKHGDGISANQLRARNSALFEAQPDTILPNIPFPLRPLVGDGLRLTEVHFITYQGNLKDFWNELTDALLPIFCPSARQTTG